MKRFSFYLQVMPMVSVGMQHPMMNKGFFIIFRILWKNASNGWCLCHGAGRLGFSYRWKFIFVFWSVGHSSADFILYPNMKCQSFVMSLILESAHWISSLSLYIRWTIKSILSYEMLLIDQKILCSSRNTQIGKICTKSFSPSGRLVFIFIFMRWHFFCNISGWFCFWEWNMRNMSGCCHRQGGVGLLSSLVTLYCYDFFFFMTKLYTIDSLLLYSRCILKTLLLL